MCIRDRICHQGFGGHEFQAATLGQLERIQSLCRFGGGDGWQVGSGDGAAVGYFIRGEDQAGD